MTHLIEQLVLDETGAELAEYGVAIALLVAIALVVYNVLGQAIVDVDSGTAAQVENAPRSYPW